MRFLLIFIFFLQFLIVPAQCAEITPPVVPQEGELYMPPETESFSDGLIYILKTAVDDLAPQFKEASSTCLSLIAVALVVALLRDFSKEAQKPVILAAVVGISVLLLKASNSLINLALETVVTLSDYGKLLLPVMATALAAQGSTSSSAALYTGTAVFSTILSSLLSKLIVPINRLGFHRRRGAEKHTGFCEMVSHMEHEDRSLYFFGLYGRYKNNNRIGGCFCTSGS